jgi:acyl carrier protein
MRDRLQAVFQEALGVGTLEDTMSPETLPDWDSLAHVGLMLSLQREFGVSISTREALELSSISKILQFLAERGVR